MTATQRDYDPGAWDVTIARARDEPHAEEKLSHTVQLLNAAIQRCRLRGDALQAAELNERRLGVYELLDLL
jgi:hypothetical protein